VLDAFAFQVVGKLFAAALAFGGLRVVGLGVLGGR